MDEKPLWRMVAGRKVGPYDPAKLRPLVKDGRISPLDRFSYDGEEWRPAGEFPELLRAPVAVVPAGLAKPAGPNPLDSDLFGPDESSADVASSDASDPADAFLPRTGSQSGSSLDEARLVKAIYMLIAFGGGMFVLLIGYIIIASLWGGSQPQPPVAVPAATNQPVVVQPQPKPEPQPQPAEPGESVRPLSEPAAAGTVGDSAPPAKTPEQGNSGTAAPGVGPAPVPAEPAQLSRPVDVPSVEAGQEPSSE